MHNSVQFCRSVTDFTQIAVCCNEHCAKLGESMPVQASGSYFVKGSMAAYYRQYVCFACHYTVFRYQNLIPKKELRGFLKSLPF